MVGIDPKFKSRQLRIFIEKSKRSSSLPPRINESTSSSVGSHSISMPTLSSQENQPNFNVEPPKWECVICEEKCADAPELVRHYQNHLDE
uniref:C2H2-type domain-containing protein n=1 Tax=Caenorhabditis tropicalis TaxID=1561998 RepID=A0A1I7TFR9_9PELO